MHIKDSLRRRIRHCATAAHAVPLPFWAACAPFFLHLPIYTSLFLHSLYRLDYSLAPHDFFYRAAAFLYPPLLWVAGTASPFFNYHRVKVAAYVLAAYNAALILASLAFQLLSLLLLPSIVKIHTDELFTRGMLLFLARLATELPLLLFFPLALKGFLHPIHAEKSRASILAFKLPHYRKGRARESQTRYPLSIARDVVTGKSITVSEADRYLHTLVDGTSGTGKTSSTILPAIRNDLGMRFQAEQKQMAAAWALMKQGTHHYTGASSFFSINGLAKVAPDANDADALEKLRLLHPVCGITVMAPEDSLTDDVCRLCEAWHMPYHRIDAIRAEDGTPKRNWIGMNPFFLPRSLSGDALHQAIVKKAVVFSDVMQAITDLKGKADSYFTGLNRQMLSNLAILVMNTVPLMHNRQATPADLQTLINNFDLLPPYVRKLEELDREQRCYHFIIRYIKDDLLGRGRPKMEDQSRGTRNIINEFLLMPGSKEVYCSQTSIDFEQVLRNGEITVCNYDLASGDSNAVAFGLFFLLSFNNAVLSRPGTEFTRTPHFFYVDELPVLIHSSLEKNFALFRKFRVAMFCAIQTLAQFEKNELTKYLKGVILGCAHILVFGRSSLSDMEVFSAMAGIREKVEAQTTVSETALSSESPSLSYSSRETIAQKNMLEEVDIRMKDFQEITFFTAQGGRPLPPIHAKVDFLRPADWDAAPAPLFSAEQFVREAKLRRANVASPASPSTDPSSHFPLVCSQTLLSQYQQELLDRSGKDAPASKTTKCMSTKPDMAPPDIATAQNRPASAPIPDGSEPLDDLL